MPVPNYSTYPSRNSGQTTEQWNDEFRQWVAREVPVYLPVVDVYLEAKYAPRTGGMLRFDLWCDEYMERN